MHVRVVCARPRESMITSQQLIQKYVNDIEEYLTIALVNASNLQSLIHETEGDSDLHRKLQMYLVPNLNHWIYGAQAGNIKDLKETLARRLVEKETNMINTQSHQGDGHDVLTKPSK